MIWIISFLFLLIGALVFYVIWLQANIRHITSTLSSISEEDTVREVTVGTNNKQFVALVNACNQLVRDNKTLIDITHKKEIAMQSSVSNLVHDLRTPLTVASGYTQIVSEELSVGKQKETLTNVIKKINDVSSSLEMLYEFSRIEEKQQLHYETIDLSKVMKELIVSYFDAFESAHINLEIEIEPNLMIQGDKASVVSMINNLIANMLKYATERAKICVTKQNESIKIVFENAMRHDSFDTDKIFDRFETFDSDGTGLGLFMIEKITSAHQWQIEADAQDGKFSISIFDVEAN